jgi:hypothetical protein
MTIQNIVLVFVVTVTLAFSRLAAATDQQLFCPEVLENHGAKIVNAPAGWTTHIHPKLRLGYVGFADASAEVNSSLAPHSVVTKTKKTTFLWKFEGENPSPLWLHCTYGGGLAVLSKELDRKFRSCKVVTTVLANKLTSREISCE